MRWLAPLLIALSIATSALADQPTAARLGELDARIAVAPDDLDLRLRRAELRLRAGNPVEALRDLEVVAAVDPDEPRLLLIRADIHTAVGSPDLALADLDRRIATGPRSAPAHEARARLRDDLGNSAGVEQNGLHPLMFVSEPENGSVVLDFHENRLSITNVRWDGQITDQPALVKGDAIVVISPDGGQELNGGGGATIEWIATPAVDFVDIDWSCDGGTTWLTIANGEPDSGSYSWRLPSIASSDAIVRVSSAADPALYDESNATFVVSSAEVGGCVAEGDDDDDSADGDDDSADGDDDDGTDDDDADPDDDDDSDSDSDSDDDDDGAPDDDDVVTLPPDDSDDGCSCEDDAAGTSALPLLLLAPWVRRRTAKRDS